MSQHNGIALLLLLSACVQVDAPKASTPDLYALECFRHAKQGLLINDTERWDVDTTREQYQSDRAQLRMPPGCWAEAPYTCEEGCK